jgi:hypothetical protein
MVRRRIDTTKKLLAKRRQIGWTRRQWANELEAALASVEALGEVFILFAKAKLAAKNGKHRWAVRWMTEFDREMLRRMIDLAVHPVRRKFDRRLAFEEVVIEMTDTLGRLREHVEGEFVRMVGNVRRGLDDAEVKEFFRLALVAARVVTG